MKIKFNHFERVAGFFVLIAVGSGLMFAVALAVKKGWFESKIALNCILETADGIHVGTQVEMAGLRIGSVEAIELKSSRQIQVHFEVSEKYLSRIHKDSKVQVVRPFIVGEKVLDIIESNSEIKLDAQNEKQLMVQKDDFLESQESLDFMDLLSGRKIGPYLSSMGKLTENLKIVANALLDQEHFKSFAKMMGDLQPLVQNMNGMSKEVNVLLKDINHKQQLSTALNNLVQITTEINKALPYLSEHAPQLGDDLTKISHNMAILTDEIQAMSPMMKELAPEFPRVSRRAIEALDETVVTLKAMQKSFFLKSNVQDVKEEESKRMPASK